MGTGKARRSGNGHNGKDKNQTFPWLINASMVPVLWQFLPHLEAILEHTQTAPFNAGLLLHTGPTKLGT